MPCIQEINTDLNVIAANLRDINFCGLRVGRLLRDTYDQLYDGQRTGRYRWDQLSKIEKEGFGPIFEMKFQRELHLKDGDQLNFQIAGVDVYCSFSQTLGGWMIPPEAQGHICLLVWADDASASWSMGIVRITLERLNTGGNRDRKATLNQHGRDAIIWLFQRSPLPPNILLQLERGDVDRIMALRSGVQRVNELFRVALGRRVGRAVVATVGEQADYMRRIRYNGGARGYLKAEGIIILGQYGSHASVAQALGVPLPGPGESVSVKVTPAEALGTGVAEISGKLWRIAKPEDRVVPAPILPEVKRRHST